ncbi:hypothetical protein E4U15_002949 [Claviceps sp. LM218 group G6]|nr:hypothetical protein E4U15_002949 [Claviceps sp. LM218 group G6]
MRLLATAANTVKQKDDLFPGAFPDPNGRPRAQNSSIVDQTRKKFYTGNWWLEFQTNIFESRFRMIYLESDDDCFLRPFSAEVVSGTVPFAATSISATK